MTIAQIGSTVTDFDAGTPTSLTTSYTQAAGTDRVLVVLVSTEGDVAVSGVTFDGVALTQEIFEAGSGRRSSIWYLINPTVTTANIVVTLASSADVGMIASSWEDVSQTMPFRASNGASGGGNPSVVVSSAVGDLVIDNFDHDDTSTATVGAGQTELAQFEVTGDFQMGASTEAGASPNVTMDWTGLDGSDFSQVAGSLMMAIVIIPPTVDAGGPYNGDVSAATPLNATVTPGTDPTPTLTWSIDSGPGGGLFLPNNMIEDPTFTPDTVGSYVLRLNVTPSDGPAVFDTATFESDPLVVAPTVDAGGPYAGTVDTPIALDATVVPGTDPTPALLWTIDAGPGTGVFSNATIEDPTFTPDLTGTYTLRLTATPSDGPPVFDTASLDSQGFVPVAAKSVVGIKTDNLGRPICAFLGIGAALPAGAVILAGDALAFDGTLLVAIDDGFAPRTMVNGLPHTLNGIRIVQETPGDVTLNGWRLKSDPPAQAINDGPPPPTLFYNKGFAIDSTGLMFVVDGGAAPTPPPPAPPALPSLLLWYDFTDGSTVFSNTAGTIPAGEGDNIRKLLNKGSATADLIDSGGGPLTYNLAVKNGLNVALSTALTAIGNNFGFGTSSGGLTFACVAKHQGSSTEQVVFKWDGTRQIQQDELGSGNWEGVVPNPTTVADTGAAVVDGEFIGAYLKHNSSLDFDVRASGQAEVAGSSPGFFNVGAFENFDIGVFDGQIGEVLVYDAFLNASESQALMDYFDTKYGTLPST